MHANVNVFNLVDDFQELKAAEQELKDLSGDLKYEIDDLSVPEHRGGAGGTDIARDKRNKYIARYNSVLAELRQVQEQLKLVEDQLDAVPNSEWQINSGSCE